MTYSNNVNASTSQVKATVTATGIGNFTGTLTQTWNINPKVVTLQWGDTSWTYDGSPHSTTCNVSNLVNGDSCTVTLSGNSITNIGQTTVTATGLSNTNYTLEGATNTSVILTIVAGMFVKISGIWTPVKQVYRKENGNWVYYENPGAVLSTSQMYIKKN